MMLPDFKLDEKSDHRAFVPSFFVQAVYVYNPLNNTTLALKLLGGDLLTKIC